MMVGRQVILTVDKKDHEATEEVLKVEGLSVRDQRDLETVHNVSFTVRGGEVLALRAYKAMDRPSFPKRSQACALPLAEKLRLMERT